MQLSVSRLFVPSSIGSLARSSASLFALLFLALTLAAPAFADRSNNVKEDPRHVNDWNRFAKAVLDLHQRRVAENDITTKEKLGGYAGMPEFYREVEYRDKASGRLLSRIQWETENPDTPHVMEVFLHDEQGRVKRDYTVAFLPGYRNAPIQTLIALHSYQGDLHGFRTFDASGNRTFERCEGSFEGEPVSFYLEDDQIIDASREKGGLMSKPLYKACFKGLSEQLSDSMVLKN